MIIPERPYVSVVIPVYNAGDYIADCLQSILNAAFVSCEIICVDDGSIDKSADIVREFIARDNRVRLIQQPNGGVSAARNIGMKAAAGQYLTFVDADDTVQQDYFDCVKQQDVDPVTVFSSQFLDTQLLSDSKTVFDKSDIHNIVIPSYLQSELNNAVFTKFYRTSDIQDNNIRFPEGMALGEDGFFNVAYLQCIDILKVVKGNTYCYRESEGGATRNLKKHNYLKAFVQGRERYHTLVHDRYDATILDRWCDIKMIRSILSILSVYFRDQPGVVAGERMAMVADILQDRSVQTALEKHYGELMQLSSRFEKFVLNAMRKRSLMRLKALFGYAHWRNGIK